MAERHVLAPIMAGGAGSRMAPLTDHRAKPAMPYAGVYRLVDFPLSNCAPLRRLLARCRHPRELLGIPHGPVGWEPALHLDDPAWPILTTAGTRLPARLFAGASVDNCLISPGCVVRGRVQRSVLGPGVVVEDGAEVFDSVLLHDAVVASGAAGAAVLDMGVRVGRQATVGRRPEAGSRGGADDPVVLGEHERVGPGAQVAPGSQASD